MTGDLYPPIEPYASGMLDVGDGHQIYWETCGNPGGAPALVLHGGPGSGASATARRYFDPNFYRIVLFDQRGCGRSHPLASRDDIDLSTNTTHHLLADIERLRALLDIDRWLLLGGSWGSTLALAYAQNHPQQVTAMVLHSIATTSAAEIEWITRGVGSFFPEAWERFQSGVPKGERDQDLVCAYHKLLMHADPAVRDKAAQDWCDWEAAILAVQPNHRRNPRWDNPAFRLCFARLVTHYWGHRGWLADDALLQGAVKLSGIPGILIHGRLDLGGPLVTPWRLHRNWAGSHLITVETAGHDAGDTGMRPAIVEAVASFESRQGWRQL